MSEIYLFNCIKEGGGGGGGWREVFCVCSHTALKTGTWVVSPFKVCCFHPATLKTRIKKNQCICNSFHIHLFKVYLSD